MQTGKGLALCLPQLEGWRFRATADAVRQPKPEPRAIRQFLVVPSIRGDNVRWAQGPGVRRCEQTL
jgi:hypothetical protein